LLGGLIKPSDRAFNFTSPMSNPLFFEDPRTLTEARLVYVNHNIPNSNPLFQGGNVQYWALQVRAALTERLSIVANKDGYIDLRGDNPAFNDGEGFADVAVGLKMNLIRSPETQFLLSGGVIYEADLGAHQVFQGRGDGEFHIFLTDTNKSSEASTGLAVRDSVFRPILRPAVKCGIGRITWTTNFSTVYLVSSR